MSSLRTGRILFLGNSITLHGPKADIGWPNNWGMAASAQDKDYVHVLVRSIAEATGKSPVIMVENIADFEQRYEVYDLAKLKKAVEFKADTVIVAIGENVSSLHSKENATKFGERLSKLLKILKEGGNPAIVVRSTFWLDRTKDEILKQACMDVGGVFVDIGGLGKDESNYARSERHFEHSGVAAHPGDKGMQNIANALLDAMKNAQTSDPRKRTPNNAATENP